MCETRLRGDGERTLHDNHKLIYSGEADGRHGVAFILAPNEHHAGTQRGGQASAQWETFRRILMQICTETLGTKTRKGTKKKQISWLTEQLKEAVRHKMQAFRRWMKTRLLHDRATYIA